MSSVARANATSGTLDEYSTRSRTVALTVAGSDSGGGAGLQADLKVFALHRVFAASVVTGVTAQSSRGVDAVHPLPASFVARQLRTVLDDLPIGVVKTGMLWGAATVRAVAGALAPLRLPLVVDPVMVAKGGAPLLRPDAVGALRRHLLPLATLVTPNLPEAEALVGYPVTTVAAMRRAAAALLALGADAALIKGGHLAGPPLDLLVDREGAVEIAHPRIETRHTHGTGCVLSASIAARLVRGIPLRRAVRDAIADVASILARAAPLGAGHGPADPLLLGRGRARPR